MKKLLPVAILVLLILGGYLGIKNYASDTAEKQVDTFLESTNEFAEVEYDDIEVEPLTQSVSLSNVYIKSKGSDDEVKAKKIVVSNFVGSPKKGEIPEQMTINIDDLLVDKKYLKRKHIYMLQQLGYNPNQLELDVTLDYHYDHSDKELEIHEGHASIDDLFAIDLQGHISGLDIDEDILDISLVDIVFTNIHSLDLTFKDDSFLDKYLERLARKEGVSLDRMNQKIVQQADNWIDPQNEEDEKILKKVARFVDNTDEIRISMYPEKPVSFSSLGMGKSPSKIIKKLNLKIK